MVFEKIKIDHKTSYLIKCNHLLRGIDAITIYNLIFIRADIANSLPLLVHEAVHVRQWRNDKFFIVKYLLSYLRSRVAGKDHKTSYLSIKYENEALRLEKLFRYNYIHDKSKKR
jgi:hypothetical protein